MRRAAGVLIALCIAAPACRRGTAVRPGDDVVIHYEMTVDGTVRESTFADTPVAIVQGAGDVPPGVDAALPGMEPGQEKTLELAPPQAFGPRDPAKIQNMALADFGALAKDLKPGKKVSGFRDGKAEQAVVLSVRDGKVSLDFNHPLAGKTVIYRVHVVSTGVKK
jgi:FKBP-type peptidyl-prolyl cis-trans isomerase SlpA